MGGIPDMDISQLAGLRFMCACGREHGVNIKRIEVTRGIGEALLKTAKAYDEGAILMVSDTNTHRVMGETAVDLLKSGGFRIKNLVYKPERALVPDETAIGRLLMAVEQDTSLIMAVGSGTLNDLCRFVSYKVGIPYCIIATAPSMDGYASTVSPLMAEGFKTTFEATAPIAILGDPECLANAPSVMISAGFGDIMGKYTALADWELSRKLNGEYYCEETVNLMKKAVARCSDNAEAIAYRDKEGIGYLMEALVLSGVAMSFAGNSRPASGAEHHLAHFWEMDALKNKQAHALHGNMVGVGALVISRIYEMADQKQKLGIEIPDTGKIGKLLKIAGCPTDPNTLGVSRELFYSSILHAKEIRPRYTILHLAEKLNILEKAAHELTETYYPAE